MPHLVLSLILYFSFCNRQDSRQPPPEGSGGSTPSPYEHIFAQHPNYISDGFDFPVGKPDAKNYYNAQKFGKNTHLGDDWNGRGGGNTDLGDPVYTVANGYVSEASDLGGGWGNVIRIVHKTPGVSWPYVESLYAHCDKMLVKKGDWVLRGAKIGTIGNNNGMYYAHLHLELRHTPDLPLGQGYSRDTSGYLDPTDFIRKHRPKK